MRFKSFYTSIYNIRLGFIKIKRKTSREEARAKPPRRRVHRGEVVRLGGVDMGQEMVSGSRR